MNVYIFYHIENLTDRYHSRGGLVVIAKDDEQLHDMITEYAPHCFISSDEWEDKKVYPLLKDETPKVFIFPDAGCC